MTSTVSRPASRGQHPGRPRAPTLALAALCAASILAGCQSSGGESTGSTLRNFVLYGGATVPPEAPLPVDDLVCPGFDIFEGGSAARSGEGRSLRYQLSIRTTARECFTQADGSRTVNVGVEVLALLGPAGSPGTFSAPLRIAVKRGDTVLDSRTRQISVAIPAGEAQNIVRIVEEGLHLPEDATGVLIEIGLGSQPARRARR
ncbi:hypothetical protein ACUSIJ_08165 [Pseudochelatococcus sp. B33]